MKKNISLPMPDWVTSYKLSGDFRGRAEEYTGGVAEPQNHALHMMADLMWKF